MCPYHYYLVYCVPLSFLLISSAHLYFVVVFISSSLSEPVYHLVFFLLSLIFILSEAGNAWNQDDSGMKRNVFEPENVLN